MTQVRFTHIGGPTVLIEFGGWRLLTDPTFDPPGRTYSFGWGTSSRKLTGPAIAAADLPDLDAVLLTHVHHGDNLDHAGFALLPAADTIVTTSSGARSLPHPARGLRVGQTTRLETPGRPPIDITATPCRHGPPLSGPVVGEVIGFALTWPGQEHGPLWITGDTVYHRALRNTAARLRPGTILLHLGGVGFPITGSLRYTMTARQAVRPCEMRVGSCETDRRVPPTPSCPPRCSRPSSAAAAGSMPSPRSAAAFRARVALPSATSPGANGRTPRVVLRLMYRINVCESWP
ncbi:MBL fold metallo-hydrolase [Nonomuraea typhae]|uniref:MBL fold metallo-hydrolase n=1 Tax=Nonomuraea typhae TaxID=2603600 RepID=UPI0012F9BB1F|nr:MBL fold metallo-hydrolase [Nonomuraea typhae]